MNTNGHEYFSKTRDNFQRAPTNQPFGELIPPATDPVLSRSRGVVLDD